MPDWQNAQISTFYHVCTNAFIHIFPTKGLIPEMYKAKKASR